MTAAELATEVQGVFRVWLAGAHPKPKRRWHPGAFRTRQLARGFCRNRAHEGTWWIVHPDGTEEVYARAA